MRTRPRLLYHRLSPDAFAPVKEKSPFDAGWDIKSRETYVLRPGEVYTFWTGLAISLSSFGDLESPFSWYWRAADKSGIAAKYGIHCLGGVIDREYRGNVGIVLGNFGFIRGGAPVTSPWSVVPGTRLCQIVPELIADVQEAEEVEFPLSGVENLRGVDGFGSTGS